MQPSEDLLAHLGLRAAVDAVVVKQRVAFSGEALVELDHSASHVGLLELKDRQGLCHLGRGAKSLKTIGEVDAGLAEDLPTAALGAEVIECRIVGVQRDAEPHGQGALQRGGVEAGHVGALDPTQ